MKQIKYNGKVYRSAADLCRKLCIQYDRFTNRIRNGHTVEDAIEYAVAGGHLSTDTNYQLVTVNGFVYASLSEACNMVGVPYSQVRYRIKHGATLEEAFNTEKYAFRRKADRVARKGNPVEDHLGNTFVSLKEMCRHYGISPATYILRKKKNWSLESILTTEARDLKKPSVDHLGNEYETQSEMCEAYNIPHTLFCKRIERGWDLSDALTRPPRERKHTK